MGVRGRSGSVSETTGATYIRGAISLTQVKSPISLSCLWLRPDPRTPAPARGNRRWTGATPPFCRPVRARGCCATYICATPPGGVAPVAIIPGGKARNDTLPGKMGCRSTPDIHNNKERLEALRKQAVEKLRGRRAYRCPHCVCLTGQEKRPLPTEIPFQRAPRPWVRASPPCGKSEISHKVRRFADPAISASTEESLIPAGSSPRPREGPILMGRDKQERVKKSPAG